ncbi:phosphonate ABC transporter substrate-binding protein [Escherichia coli]|nr:phosphonate ABC transporter substrate-binding protein [Escherichia coli]
MNAKIIASLAFTSMFSLSTLLSPAHAEEQEKALNFGIISTESQQNLKPQWTPFLQDMEKKLGVKVNAFFAPDYAGIIQGMRFNKVDIAWYGNLSAMEAVDRANGQVFAQTVAADGSPGYWSVLIVNKDSPINNLNDLLAKRKDLTFGNGDPNSTSGFLVPGYYVFAKNNISASDFKRTVNAGHETNALAVANKQVDVATNNTENLDKLKTSAPEKLKTSAPEKLKELKVIWKSPLIPGDPIVWRKNLSETTKDKIYDFFMNYGKTPEEKAVLERLGWAPFRASSDLQLVPIRQLALFKEMQGVKSNKGLNEQDKLAKTTEIQAQLDDLDRLNNALSAMSSVSKAVQ